MMKNIAVYLGSSLVCDQFYNDLAFEVGRRLAEEGFTVVYGGATVGTMGRLADGVESVGGELVGVFPRDFRGTAEAQRLGIDVVRHSVTRMVDVADFPERKARMEENSDCALVLPGSFGTLDEMFTYADDHCIGEHDKPVYVLNARGFFDGIKLQMETIEREGFLKPTARGVITFCDTLDDFLKYIS